MSEKNFVDLGMEIGELLRKKNAAYGNSFEEAEKVLKVLFPNGVPVEKYQDFLTITRIIDKLFRIATDKNAFSEDPWRDIAGYAILSLWSQQPARRGIDLEEERKSREEELAHFADGSVGNANDVRRVLSAFGDAEYYRSLLVCITKEVGNGDGEMKLDHAAEMAADIVRLHYERKKQVEAGHVFEFTKDEADEIVRLRKEHAEMKEALECKRQVSTS